jgi:hypothetical protein
VGNKLDQLVGGHAGYRVWVMNSKKRQILIGVWVILLIGLTMTACQAFEEPPQGVLTPQEMIFTSAAETVLALLTPTQTPVLLFETPTPSPNAEQATNQTPDEFQSFTITPLQPTLTPSLTPLQPTLTPSITPFLSPTMVSAVQAPSVALPDPVVPANTPPPPVTTERQEYSLVFEDDFGIKTGWHTEMGTGFEMYYQADGYRIRNRNTHTNVSSIRNLEHRDLQVEVDVAQVSGPPGSYYGVVCRWQNLQNLYAFVIGGDGMHAILKVQNAEVYFLKEGREENVALQLGSEVRRVSGACEGNLLVMEVDGRRLLEAEDSTFSSGYVGLLVGNQDQPGSLVHFDNFSLYAP